MLFPSRPTTGTTGIELVLDDDGFPVVLAVGLLGDDASAVPLLPHGPGLPLLGEHARGRFTRPHLRGHRDGGTAWSTRFECLDVQHDDATLRISLRDAQAGLDLLTEAESLPGGALRLRHTLTNTAATGYHLDGLEVVVPAPDHLTEVLDFTGRHERERQPQRHGLTDGLRLRESGVGRPGLGAATMTVVGTPGFSTSYGEVLAVHVAWSGSSVLRVERDPATGTTVGGGEQLLPGELTLASGESYATPWVHVIAADDGLDGVAAALHAHQRSLPAHPDFQPVVLNVWEAVFFDHDLDRLRAIADRAASVGVERFVLDDGWFTGRRDDTAGLGDWAVDPAVWPEGLSPIVDHVKGLGMEFGLWIEPEMVNPDSDLYRAHPDWILATGDRVPLLWRHQLVLDLSRDEVREHVFAQISAVLGAYPVDAVKWDHNRDLLEAGSAALGGAPAVHRQTLAFYRLLDDLRAAHPAIDWESCASGGGRIDLGVLERVQRVWTSDMTDAMARQQIQRWTTQLVAPEYAGAHVSSPTSHTTGRTLPLDLRCATAMFGAFGIESDLTLADDDDLARLGRWIARYRQHRPLLHSGRVVRPESPDPTVLLHGVVAADRSEALLAHVQLDEPSHNRGVFVRVPGLDPAASYALAWEGEVDHAWTSMSSPLAQAGPTDGVPVTGRLLATRGYWVPRRKPETVTLVHATRV
ncbi:alpha-galactosidase [Nocardioides aurantiacus]|uniref:alpha-galactosidase n=1 Tax=Nocardioides aurantiacus TaxID=86796 RepID=UPI00403F548C